MATYADALAGKIKSGFCQATAAADKYYTIFQRILPDSPLLQLPSFPGALNGVFCNRNPEDLPTNPPPPFTGGQCTNVQYQVTTTSNGEIKIGANWFPLGSSTTQTNCIQGPITGAGWDSPNPGRARFVVRHGNNQVNVRRDFSGDPGTEYRNLTGSIDSITPCGGATDNCGDPPSPPPNALPPGTNTVEDDVDFTDENNVNVTVPIVLVYGTANINVNGQIIIPVDVRIGPNTLEVDLNLNTGNINFGPSYTTNNPGEGTGGRGTNSPCEQPPEVDEDEAEPDNGVPTETPIEDKESDIRVIIGAIVTVTNEGNGIGEVNGDPYNAPDIGVPRFGDLMFEVRIANRTAWLNDIPVKLARVYIPCPWDAGALRVVGIPKPGVVWTITPVYSRIKKPRDTVV